MCNSKAVSVWDKHSPCPCVPSLPLTDFLLKSQQSEAEMYFNSFNKSNKNLETNTVLKKSVSNDYPFFFCCRHSFSWKGVLHLKKNLFLRKLIDAHVLLQVKSSGIKVFFIGLSIWWKLSQAEMFLIRQNLLQTSPSHCCTATLGGITTVLSFGEHVVQAVDAENQSTKMLWTSQNNDMLALKPQGANARVSCRDSPKDLKVSYCFWSLLDQKENAHHLAGSQKCNLLTLDQPA